MIVAWVLSAAVALLTEGPLFVVEGRILDRSAPLRGRSREVHDDLLGALTSGGGSALGAACEARQSWLRDLVKRGAFDEAVAVSTALGARDRVRLRGRSSSADCAADEPHVGLVDVYASMGRPNNKRGGQEQGQAPLRRSVAVVAGHHHRRSFPCRATSLFCARSATGRPVVGAIFEGDFVASRAHAVCSSDETDGIRRCSHGALRDVPFADLEASVRHHHHDLASARPSRFVHDADSDYVVAPKTLLVIPVCPSDASNCATVFDYELVASQHGGSVHAYLNKSLGVANDFLKDASYGRFHLQPVVYTPILKVPYLTANCGEANIEYHLGEVGLDTLAFDAAAAAGFNVTDYDHNIVVLPYCDDLSYSGVGWVGFPGSLINLRAADYDASIVHELGHNFGANHASTTNYGGKRGLVAQWDKEDASSWVEYGNDFSTMGSAFVNPDDHDAAQYVVATKMLFDWIDDDRVAFVEPFDYNGTTNASSSLCSPACGPYVLEAVDVGALTATIPTAAACADEPGWADGDGFGCNDWGMDYDHDDRSDCSRETKAAWTGGQLAFEKCPKSCGACPNPPSNIWNDGAYAAVVVATALPNRSLFVEYRAHLGGLVLTWADFDPQSDFYDNSVLVDAHPETADSRDAVLRAGESVTVDLSAEEADAGTSKVTIYAVEATTMTTTTMEGPPKQGGFLAVEIDASATARPTVSPAPTTAKPTAVPTAVGDRCGSDQYCCGSVTSLAKGHLYTKVTYNASSSLDSCCAARCTYEYAAPDGTYYLQWVAPQSRYYATLRTDCITEGTFSYVDSMSSAVVASQCGTRTPTRRPTDLPTTPRPSSKPTTLVPTRAPTPVPTARPATPIPTAHAPTPAPSTTQPTRQPTRAPTIAPTKASIVSGTVTFSGITLVDATANEGVFKAAIASLLGGISTTMITLDFVALEARRRRRRRLLLATGDASVISYEVAATSSAAAKNLATLMNGAGTADLAAELTAAAATAGATATFSTLTVEAKSTAIVDSDDANDNNNVDSKSFLLLVIVVVVFVLACASATTCLFLAFCRSSSAPAKVAPTATSKKIADAPTSFKVAPAASRR